MPWAMGEPTLVEQIRERLTGFYTQFDRSEEWLYGIFTPDGSAVIGGTGLHKRIGPTGLEIGAPSDFCLLQFRDDGSLESCRDGNAPGMIRQSL